MHGFTSTELSIIKRLDTPSKIQSFLDNSLAYNLEENGETYYSAKLVLKHRKAHCLEGALFAAVALCMHGYPPLLLDLKAVRDDDRVLAVYKIKNHWGAIAQSKFSGLKFRDPVYSSIRELVMSYFEYYYNYAGEKTLREFSMPVNLSRFDKKAWMVSEEPLEYIADYLHSVKHKKILPPHVIKSLGKVSPHRLKTELIVKPK